MWCFLMLVFPSPSKKKSLLNIAERKTATLLSTSSTVFMKILGGSETLGEELQEILKEQHFTLVGSQS